VTTHDVSNSCEVLWIPRQRQDAVAEFFKVAETDLQALATDLDLFADGARWLAALETPDAAGNNLGGSDYLYPDAAGYSDVVACSWNKDTSSPAGAFNILLKPRIPYGDLIKPGDLFVIYLDDDHLQGQDNRSHGTLISVVVVEQVGKAIRVEDNATIEMVSVSGGDLGRIFQMTELIFDPALSDVQQIYFSGSYMKLTTDHKSFSLSPPEMIWTLLGLVYDPQSNALSPELRQVQDTQQSQVVATQWAFTSTDNTDSTGRPISLLRMVDVTSFVQVPMMGFCTPDIYNFALAGNVWTLLDGYANRVVNEFFVDVRDAGQDEAAFLVSAGNNAMMAPMDQDDVTRTLALRTLMQGNNVFGTAGMSPMAQSATTTTSPDVQPTVTDLDAAFDVQPSNDPNTLTSAIPNDGTNTGTVPVIGMVLRQLPYDLYAFHDLPTNNLDYTEVFNTDIDVSNHEVANFFRIRFPDLPNWQQELVYGLTLLMESIAQHGIRRLEAETRYCFATSKLGVTFDTGGDTDQTSIFQWYIGLLSTWYAAQDLLLSGTITCRHKPQIRIGTRLIYTAPPRIIGGGPDQAGQSVSRVYSFYVQGVAHSYDVAPGASQTTLTLIRGIDENGRGLANNLIWVPGALDNSGVMTGNQIPSSLITIQTLLEEGFTQVASAPAPQSAAPKNFVNIPAGGLPGLGGGPPDE
jgi:hypothetical protein